MPKASAPRRIDTQDVRARNCGAWVYLGADESRALGADEYTFSLGVYGFRKDVAGEKVFVLTQLADGEIRLYRDSGKTRPREA